MWDERDLGAGLRAWVGVDRVDLVLPGAFPVVSLMAAAGGDAASGSAGDPAGTASGDRAGAASA